MLELQLKGGGQEARVLKGHPWVFAGEIRNLLGPEAQGEGVLLRDARGRLLGSGLYNGRSQIVWRRYSRREHTFDRECIEGLMVDAFERRAEERFRRLVWSEADDLPGLVVDQFDDVLVVQTLTLGMDQRLDDISEALMEAFEPSEILFRNDAPGRRYEGLEQVVGTRSGALLEPRWYRIDDVEYRLDLAGAQKTGFYLDQRAQHRRVGHYARGRRVLDGFCNQGSFALHCALAGAASVLAVDSSEGAIQQARDNAQRNGAKIECVAANMFDYFTHNRTATFDMIGLDPPSFARNKASVAGALRGYKELNLRAMRMLSEGGILATYSCSQNVSREVFMGMLADAAADVGRKARVLEEARQPADHPVLLNVPETEYLKGAILQIE